MSAAAIDYDHAAAKLHELGLLLETDRAFPSLVAMMAGGPVKGTWWAHPLANDIYMTGMRLMKRDDVLYLRFIAGKMTYIDRRLWPALYAIGIAREPWQLRDLPAPAKLMLRMLDRRGSLRMDEIKSSRSRKELGGDARVLESRLLAFGDDVHTASGTHVKRLETWSRWAERIGFDASEIPSAERARNELERIVAQINRDYAADASLPWQMAARAKLARTA